jgi:hypothetical protein
MVYVFLYNVGLRNVSAGSGKNSRKVGFGSDFNGMKPGFEGPEKEE